VARRAPASHARHGGGAERPRERGCDLGMAPEPGAIDDLVQAATAERRIVAYGANHDLGAAMSEIVVATGEV
jgi:hypothetical protein